MGLRQEFREGETGEPRLSMVDLASAKCVQPKLLIWIRGFVSIVARIITQSSSVSGAFFGGSDSPFR